MANITIARAEELLKPESIPVLWSISAKIHGGRAPTDTEPRMKIASECYQAVAGQVLLKTDYDAVTLIQVIADARQKQIFKRAHGTSKYGTYRVTKATVKSSATTKADNSYDSGDYDTAYDEANKAAKSAFEDDSDDETSQQARDDEAAQAAESETATTGISEARIRALITEAINTNNGKLAVSILQAVAASQKLVLDQMDKRIEELKLPTRIEIIREDDNNVKVTEDAGLQHFMFPELLAACQAREKNGQRLCVMLVGPAGSGKTTAAEMVANILKVPFYFTGALSAEYKVMGFMNANGTFVDTDFHRAYPIPSVFLADEFDGSAPNAGIALNAATANGWCDFPHGKVARHKDNTIIAACNTWCGGATMDFVGRFKQDAAAVDRFVMLEWPIDEALELATCPADYTDWCRLVQRLRQAAARIGERVVISPRATYKGAALLKAGLKEDTVIKMAIRKGIPTDTWDRIKRAA